jgi:NADH-quinone oxidoreductase subunit A
LNPPTDVPALWPLGAYFGGVILVAAGMLGVSYVLGERHKDRTMTPYEGGIVPLGFARLRMSAHFYLVAMLFVIFDLETAFIVTWAVAARELGWAGYIEILVFIGVLTASLAYLWKMGALDQAGKTREPKGA